MTKLPLLCIPFPQHETIKPLLRQWLLSLADKTPDKESNLTKRQSYFQHKWLSHNQLHLSGNEQLEQLSTFIENAVNKHLRNNSGNNTLSIFSMWSIISKPGMLGLPHNHVGHVSSIYYVDTGTSGESDGGQLHFYLSNLSKLPSHSITPKPGHLYLFPSSLHHSVSPYQGNKPRIIISANLK